jgi:transcriptional regulator with XRE-family HTH domain
MGESIQSIKDRRAEEFRHYLTRLMMAEMTRKGRRVSDAELAESLGIGTTTFNHWLNNRRYPSLEQIIPVIISTKEVEAARILGYYDQFKQLAYVMLDVKNEGLRYMIEAWSRLDEAERKDVLTRIRNAAGAEGDINAAEAKTEASPGEGPPT